VNSSPGFAAIITQLVMMSVWSTAYGKNGQLQTKHLLIYSESGSRKLFAWKTYCK